MIVEQDSVHVGTTGARTVVPLDEAPPWTQLPFGLVTSIPPPPDSLVMGRATGWVTVTGKEPMVRTMVKIDTLKFDGSPRLMTPFATKVATCAALSGVEVALAMKICDGFICVTNRGVDDSDARGGAAKLSTAVAISVFC